MADLLIDEVAKALRISKKTVYRRLWSGDLRGHRTGSRKGGWRIPAEEVDRVRREGGGDEGKISADQP